MKILAERTFTLVDQICFASLSGDFNPMHLDEVTARRTIMGAPVVHGVHLLFWALDAWLKSCPGTAALEHLAVVFKRGVLIGERARVFVVSEGEHFTLRILRDQAEVTAIRGSLGTTRSYRETLPQAALPSECRAMNSANIAQATGSLPLSYCEKDTNALFPDLTRVLPPYQLAGLFATTRLIGMECPGLHSLYSALDLSFGKEAVGPAQMNYQVEHTRDAEFCLAVNGPGFAGELEGSVRPEPRQQATARQLAPLVERGEFSGQRPLVIGGSRGLGEVVAKLLALGGANVTITYHRGKQDAEGVAAEINAAGGQCAVAPFDTQCPTPLTGSPPPTHLYYFATPHITADRSVVFSAKRFEEYCRYYATDFVNTVLTLANGAPMLEVFYPSTVFLDEHPSYMAEYCAAKAAGEEICKHLALRFPEWLCHAPRLPRMLTDQNNGLIQTDIASPESIMLNHLRDMKGRSRGKDDQRALALAGQ